MNIFFRVDCSHIIGTGHIIRCLKLSKYFDGNIYFICKKFKNNLNQKVIENGYNLFEIDIDTDYSNINDTKSWLGESFNDDALKTINVLKNYKVDLLIIDQYAIDYKWQNLVKKYVKKILVLDDYIERRHNCDYILNSLEDNPVNYNEYKNNSKLLLGNDYFIISKEFLKSAESKKFNKNISRVFIFISGSDVHNYTYDICKKIENKYNHIIFDILVGGANINYKQISELCFKNTNFNYYFNIEKVHEIMILADVCIGSLGQNFIERCVLGIPSIVFTIADNQLGFLEKYKDKKMFLYCGHKPSNLNNVLEKFESILNNNQLWLELKKSVNLYNIGKNNKLSNLKKILY